MISEPLVHFDARVSARVPLTYRFGPFLVDVNRRILFDGSQARSITEKVFQVLVLLLEADGGIVNRETFFARIWPSDASEGNLAQHIFLLRNLLGERSRDHSFIVTVPGKGYRLAAPVEKKLGLAMKARCEGCGFRLQNDTVAYICSYECTFCDSCAERNKYTCPNCGGEQTCRPRRAGSSPATTIGSITAGEPRALQHL